MKRAPIIVALIALIVYHWSNLASGADDKARNAVLVAVVFVLAGHVFNRLVPVKNAQPAGAFRAENLARFGLALLLAGIAAHLIFYLEHLGQIMQYRDNYLLARGRGYLTVFFDWVPLGILMCLQANQEMNKKSLALACYLSAVIYIAFYLFVLMKRKQLLLLLIGVFILNYSQFKKKKLFLLGAVAAAYVFLMVFGQVRGFYDAHGLLETFEYIKINFTPQWLVLDNFEGRYTSVILSDVIFYTDRYGIQPWILVADLTAIVPRALWPSKLMTLSEWYSYTFHPVLYERGGAYASSLIAESYFALSWIGVVVVFFMVGFLCSKADRLRTAGYTVTFSVVVYVLSLLPRLGGSSIVIYILFLLLPSWLAYRLAIGCRGRNAPVPDAEGICKIIGAGVRGHAL